MDCLNTYEHQHHFTEQCRICLFVLSEDFAAVTVFARYVFESSFYKLTCFFRVSRYSSGELVVCVVEIGFFQVYVDKSVLSVLVTAAKFQKARINKFYIVQ